jgi:hypothetical protein
MNFSTITIPDPAAVVRWLDEQLPGSGGCSASFGRTGWTGSYFSGLEWTYGQGRLPEELLADIRRQLAENDPLAKLRKEAEKHGYALMKLPED